MATIDQLEHKVLELERKVTASLEETGQLQRESHKALDTALHAYRLDAYGYLWAYNAETQTYHKTKMRVMTPEIADEAIKARHIAERAVTGDKIADKAIDRSKMTDELINELRQVDVVDLLLGGVLDEYYTKEEIDVLLQELELDDYAKKEWVESKGYLTARDISGKADKSDTYTKTQVISLVEALKKLDIVPVEELPQPPSEETRRKLFFVPKPVPNPEIITIEERITVTMDPSEEETTEVPSSDSTEVPSASPEGQEETQQQGETAQEENTEENTSEETPTEETPADGTNATRTTVKTTTVTEENAHDVYVTVVNTTYPEVEDDWKNVINLGDIHESRYEKIIKDLGVGTYIFNVLGTIKGTAYIYRVTPLSMTYDEPAIPEKVAVGQMAMNRDGKYYQVAEDGRWKEFIPASTYEWKCIGTTHINFNAYYTKEEIDNLFAKKTEVETVTGITQSEYHIDPNRFYKFTDPLTYLWIILNAPTDESIVNEYMFEFVAADGFEFHCDGIRWGDGEAPEWEIGNTYQVSILNGLAVAAGWEAAG